MSATHDDLVRAIGMQNDCINDLRAEVTRLTQERDDAKARGEAMFEKLQPALAVAEAEIKRYRNALLDLEGHHDDLVRAIGMQNDCINDLRAEVTRLTQERDDAEARGEAMFEKLQPALTIAEAEISRLTAALEEIDTVVRSDEHHARIAEIAYAALSGKGES